MPARAISFIVAPIAALASAVAWIAVVSGLLFATFAFADWSINPGLWDSFDRGFAAFFGLVIGGLGALVVAIGVYVRIVEP